MACRPREAPCVYHHLFPPWKLALEKGLNQQTSTNGDFRLRAPHKLRTINCPEQFPYGPWDISKGWGFPLMKQELWSETNTRGLGSGQNSFTAEAHLP